MFGKSKIVRVIFWACLAAAWLPLGNGLLQPSQASAAEFVRGGWFVRRDPVIKVAPVVPVVPVAPVITVDPVVRVGPVYPHAWFGRWHR